MIAETQSNPTAATSPIGTFPRRGAFRVMDDDHSVMYGGNIEGWQKDAKMLSFETASRATDLSNLLFIGVLLTIIVFGALGAYVANKRSR